MCLSTPCRTRIRAQPAPAIRNSCLWCGGWPVPARRCPGPRHRPCAREFRRPILGATPPLHLPVVDRALRCRAAAGALRRRLAADLDVDAMTVASRELLGLHDFAAFCRHRDGATTIRDLQRLDWSRDGDLITAHVTADAFCWSMVRSLVGALLAVGEHRRTADWCRELLTATGRSSDFAAAPARGLTLIGVDYPPDDQLASRILITRDLRSR